MKGLKKVVAGVGLMIISVLTVLLSRISEDIVVHLAQGSYYYGGLYYIMSFLFVPGLVLLVWGMIEKD